MIRSDEADRYRAVVAALPDPTRCVVRLHCVLGWEFALIAQALRILAREVEDHLAEALASIGRALDGASGSAH